MIVHELGIRTNTTKPHNFEIYTGITLNPAIVLQSPFGRKICTRVGNADESSRKLQSSTIHIWITAKSQRYFQILVNLATKSARESGDKIYTKRMGMLQKCYYSESIKLGLTSWCISWSFEEKCINPFSQKSTFGIMRVKFGRFPHPWKIPVPSQGIVRWSDGDSKHHIGGDPVHFSVASWCIYLFHKVWARLE